MRKLIVDEHNAEDVAIARIQPARAVERAVAYATSPLLHETLQRAVISTFQMRV